MFPDPDQIGRLYRALLDEQEFNPAFLDYSAFEERKDLLDALAKTGRSAISVFDMYQKKHIYYSPNFAAFLGYSHQEFTLHEQERYNARIHPDDFLGLTLNGISLLKLFYAFSPDEKKDFKLVNEFRVRSEGCNYVRHLEQHQVLELDRTGNLWLALSILDISPNQDATEGIKSQLMNIRTGELVPFSKHNDPSVELSPALTSRELEILRMVRDGLLSKEISDRLGISLHTVNTHRQRVLQKLDANNSIEAIAFAHRYGLI